MQSPFIAHMTHISWEKFLVLTSNRATTTNWHSTQSSDKWSATTLNAGNGLVRTRSYALLDKAIRDTKLYAICSFRARSHTLRFDLAYNGDSDCMRTTSYLAGMMKTMSYRIKKSSAAANKGTSHILRSVPAISCLCLSSKCAFDCIT